MSTSFCRLSSGMSLLALLFATTALPAVAAEEKPIELPAVTVTAAQVNTAAEAYTPLTSTTATKTETPLKETPVSVAVIDKQVIADKAVTAPNQLADLTSGVQPIVGYGATPSALYTIRGFSTAGVNFRNGYKILEPYNPRDLANVERVEFIKGPSLLYGAAQPGGSVNMVTKTPEKDNFLRLKQGFGSNQYYRTTIDANRDFGDVAVRLNAAGTSAESHLDFYRENNLFAAPVVRWNINDSTSLLYEGEIQKYKNNGWTNGLPNTASVLDAPFSVNVSDDSSYFRNETYGHRLELQHAFNKNWSVRQGVYVDHSKRSYLVAQPYWGSTATTFDRMTFYAPDERSRNVISQSEVYGTFNTAAVKHDIVAGFEASRNLFQYALASGDQYDAGGNFIGTDLGVFDLFNPDYANKPAELPVSFAEKKSLRSSALYTQDSLAWEKWRFLAGIRAERAHSSVVDLTGGSDAKSQTENAVTGRAGAMYLVTPETGVYYSWSQSFSPNYTARSATNDVFTAERGVQHEVGVKHTLREGLEATAALFQVTKENVLVADPANPGFSITSGEQRSRGLELGMSGQVTEDFRVIANATFQKAKITKTTDGDSTPVGTELLNVPEHAANLWGVYDLPVQGVPGQLSLGVGVVYVGEREGTQPNSDFKLASYIRYDAGVFYKVNRYNMALNLQNLSNEKHLETVEGALSQIAPPFTMLLTVGVDF
jgi:iron complex outermembrane recepter protein